MLTVCLCISQLLNVSLEATMLLVDRKAIHHQNILSIVQQCLMGQLPVSHHLHMLQAFVDFDSGAEAERAITTKDRQVFAQKFGDRYVRLVQACS